MKELHNELFSLSFFEDKILLEECSKAGGKMLFNSGDEVSG